jgi:hypothetical protein
MECVLHEVADTMMSCVAIHEPRSSPITQEVANMPPPKIIPPFREDLKGHDGKGGRGELDVIKPVTDEVSLHLMADQSINQKWDSLAHAPGSPKIPGDAGLIKFGEDYGYYREYANGRIYYQRTLDAFWVHGLIGDKYIQLGGPGSWLGWPIADEQAFTQDGAVGTFQNGAIYWWPGTEAIELGKVLVRYAGLVCFGETDDQPLAASSADEPYVVLGVVPAIPGQELTLRTGIYENVDKGDSREDNIELYRGLPYGLALGVVVMEHDLADPDKYRETIKASVDAAAQGVKAGVGLIPYVGPALAIIADQLLKAIAPDIVEFVNDTLDLKDDVIGKVAWNITPKDMVTMARAPQNNFKGVLHKMESPLIDEGDGAYKVYLDIQAV